MSNMENIAGLTEVTSVTLQTLQTEMAAIRKREEGLRQNLSQLVADRAEQAEAALENGAATPLAGSDIRWHAWVDQQRAKINGELAVVLAEKEACQQRLQQAFGRDLAAQALRKKVVLEKRIVATRRAAYES